MCLGLYMQLTGVPLPRLDVRCGHTCLMEEKAGVQSGSDLSKVTQLAPWQDLNPGSSLRANAPLARGHASLGRGGQRVRTTLTLSFGFRHALALRCSCLHPTETGPTLARMEKGHVRILEACLVTGLEARGRQHWWI